MPAGKAMFKIRGADGKEYGPVNSDQLRDWIRQGRANAQTQVLPADETEWKPLGEMPEFEDVLGRQPEPIPPLTANSPLPGDVLERDYDLDVIGCFSQSTELLRASFGMVFGACAIYLLIQGGISGLGSIPFIGPIFSIASLFVVGQLIAGVYITILRVIRHQPAGIGDIFLGFKTAYVPLLLGYLVSMVITMASGLPGALLTGIPVAIMVSHEEAHIALILLALVGVIVFLVPVIYLSTSWMFTLPLIMDKGLDFWKAMQTSRKVVGRHWWSVFGLLLLVGLLNLGGLLVCCIGIFLSFPLTMAAVCFAYETLFSERNGQPA